VWIRRSASPAATAGEVCICTSGEMAVCGDRGKSYGLRTGGNPSILGFPVLLQIHMALKSLAERGVGVAGRGMVCFRGRGSGGGSVGRRRRGEAVGQLLWAKGLLLLALQFHGEQIVKRRLSRDGYFWVARDRSMQLLLLFDNCLNHVTDIHATAKDCITIGHCSYN
jgi:hypothetical protein